MSHRPPNDRPRLPRLPLFLAFLLWPILLVGTYGPIMSDSVLLAAMRLVDRGSWTLDDGDDPRRVFLTTAHDISVHDDRIYSGVGPGASLVAAPFYVVLRPVFGFFGDDVVTGGRFQNYYRNFSRALDQPVSEHFKDLYLLQIALAWLLIAPLYASFLTRFHGWITDRGHPAAQATLIVVAVGLGSMALYYSSMYSRQALAYLLLWHALLTLFGRRSVGPGFATLAGALAGLAVAVDYPALILVALTLIFALPRLTRNERVAFVAPILLGLVLLGLYHRACFGSVLSTPYHHRFWYTPEPLAERGIDLAEFQRGRLLGVQPPDPGVMLRLCFGPFKGLFVYSPILLLGLAGHIVGIRRGRERAAHAFALLVFCAYLAFNSGLGTHVPEFGRHFWGGLSVLWGPRYLFAVLPLLAYGLVGLDWHRRALRVCGFVALGISIALNLLGTLFGHVMASTDAFSDALRYPPIHAVELLFRLGPRVTLLDVYQVRPAIQAGVLALAGIASVWLLLRFTRR